MEVKKRIVLSCLAVLSFPFTIVEPTFAAKGSAVCQNVQENPRIIAVNRLNPTTVEVLFNDNQRMTLDFYGDNIFRVFQDNAGGIIRNPEAEPEAQILVNQPRKEIKPLSVAEKENHFLVVTDRIQIELNKTNSCFKVTDLKTGKVTMEVLSPVEFKKGKVFVQLKEGEQEYFYGGGVQNGRFSHKGKAIAIVNQNSWTDGGVASPTPFYWSTNGYGIMFHTFSKGKYDFGAERKGVVKLMHESDYLDMFCMVGDGAVENLNNFYQLTGHPILLPKFGFYEGHLNAYNRDYWKEDNEKGILFEDGKKYKESQKDKSGIKESLNGEKNNYQFSARAVIDRYKTHDMPLGWILPNDGYGAGYGQTNTLDGNIKNLKDLGDYARQHGVEIGLWTQSDLHPKEGVEPLLQRDIVKEVRDAGVRVLKTDVAWVGAGYSFGLNGVSDVGQIMPYYGNDARPFIISLDGWAGTQRYAGVWSGDQTGGQWEYIRFHIPTYIGSGLSGQPNITSDMDGIFGGKNVPVNIRDFQWKTWTPMQLNMDGWGSTPKYPHILGEPAASINRMYLKMKSELLPYSYNIARESVDGLPMIRAMFLEYPNAYTLGKATQYQYMFGPDFLVAPIYQETQMDEKGNDIRDGIYLPEGEWIDYFTGDVYQGGRVINNFQAPIWKLPVFVRKGAILSLTNPNNNVAEVNNALRIYEFYPGKYSSVTEYDDDGKTEEYRKGKSVTTLIESFMNEKGEVDIHIHPAKGDFTGFESEKQTELRINVTEKPKSVKIKMGGKNIKLTEVVSKEAFDQGENCMFFNKAPNLNKYATPGSEFENVAIIKNPVLYIKLAKTDVTATSTDVKIKGFVYDNTDKTRLTSGTLQSPKLVIPEENIEAYTVTPTWEKVSNADFYEIELNGILYSTIKNNSLLFTDLTAETDYTFKIRSVNKDGYSDWNECTVTTKHNPLEFALHGLSGECSVESQGRRLKRLFDFEDKGDVWHSKYGAKAVPFELIIDLKTFNQLDKFHYLGRLDCGNGTILKGSVAYSMDKERWTDAGEFTWKRDVETKVFQFKEHPTARYIKLSVTEAVGNYGSGREIYVFKVPGTESYIPGDINNDGKIDQNDLTSYINYTGLRKGDSDFEGYISNGDINQNDLIDAYDISVVGTQLEGGVQPDSIDVKVAGKLEMKVSKKQFNKGDEVLISIKGVDLKSVNALSFALPYDPDILEYVGIEPINMKQMENLTYDRLHTNGSKALYPTFINLGNREILNGNEKLFIIKLKAKKKGSFINQMQDVILVDKLLRIQK